jgi:nucleoside-diphosphate-sugar epimerase
VLRAGFNYGPGSASIEALHHALISGSGLTGIQSNHAASWVHGADLAQAIVLAAEQQPAGEIFNIAADEPVTVNAFVDQFADALGVDHPTRREMPQFIGNLTTPALTRALMSTAFQVSSAKASERLGWSPDYANVASGFEQTLLSWRATEAS